MAFHRSRKYGQPPVPGFTIQLNQPFNNVYRSGDFVQGNIFVTPVQLMNPTVIEVLLCGWTTTYFTFSSTNTTSYYRDLAPLLELTSNIAGSSVLPYLEPGRTYTFPFRFRFPQYTWNSRYGNYKKAVDQRWTPGPHILPPTFYYRKGGRDYGYISIDYSIKARLQCPGIDVINKERLEPLTTSLPILFSPRQPQILDAGLMILSKQIKVIEFRSSSLLAHALDTKERLQARFPWHRPTVHFKVTVETPTIVKAGSDFLLKISATIGEKSPSVIRIPAIQLTILKLLIRDTTHARALYDKRPSKPAVPDRPYSGPEYQHRAKHKTNLVAIPSTAVIAPQSDTSDDGTSLVQTSQNEAWFKVSVPETLPASFKSFAITRYYSVKMKLGIEIAGKKFKWRLKTPLGELDSSCALRGPDDNRKKAEVYV